jgi:amino acid adenylation domain-containing protein/non-ribosomal peptide synthase protein (TIGR01720 family)
MTSSSFNEAEKYFDTLLEDVEMIAYPHSDKPDGTENANNAYIDARISKEAVDTFCKQNAVTANNFFLTVLMQVLHRLTREERIAITTISNGRNDTLMHTIMGMFVKTLPVASRLDKEETFVDALVKMNKQSMTSIGYDIYPFTKLVERYKFRSEIMYVFQGGLNTPVVKQENNEIPLDLDTTKMPIALMVTETANGEYNLQIEYDTHLYSNADMTLLGNALKAFALQALNGVEKLRDISLTSQEEQARILELSKGEDMPYDKSETFVDMVCHFAETTPDAVAVVDKTSSITYRQLHLQSNTLAARLIAEGVKPDTFVGIMLPRQKEFITSLLGIMKAGAAYVPMDNEYPTERLLYMMEDSRAKVLLTTHDIYESKQQESKSEDGSTFKADKVIFMDEELATTEKTVNLTHPDGLAYMIYTSGSTGKPKGVMIPHRGLRAYLAWRIAKIGITAESRHVAHPSFSFDASLDDLLCPLAAGACVHILPEELRKDMDGIYNYIKEQRITGLSLSTALGMTLLGTFPDLPVEFMMMGGEKMLPIAKTKVRIINGYGPTEFSVCSSFHVVDQDKDVNIPIGRPVPNSYSLICDAFGQLLPIGAAGELCLSGIQMSKGYWQRDELTQQKFCDTPFGYKVYHTGDLARWNEEGELEFLGRIDNQVKLRGFRIELGEIDNQASLIEGIKAVAAEVREANGSKHLVLYFTAEQPMDTDAIRERLSESLTEYMVPDTYMQLDEMPMTPNGKVNRRALPQPVIRSAAEYVEPQTEAERIVAQAMQDVLGLKQHVGALDSFFAWGGDSIKSIRLVSRLRSEGITLQVADIMKLKTVREIAAAGSQGTVEISQEAWSGEVPQTAITSFFFDLNLPKPYHVNQTMFIKAAQRVQVEALQQAVEALVKHHDMLRAIVRNNQLYVRNIDEPHLYGWEQLDYTQDADYVKNIERVCRNRQASISLSNGPMFKVVLFNTPDYDAILMVCHHLVVDGVSWRVLLEDFNMAYGQAAEGNAITLPAKTHSFKEYAETLQSYAQSHELNVERTYWDRVQEKLQHLPSSKAKDCARSMNLVNASLDAQTTHSITTTAGTPYHADINDLLMTALGRSYYKLTGNDAVSVQFEGHGREYIGNSQLMTDRTVGWFTSVYPVVLEHLDGDLRSCMRQTKETMHRIPNKGVGYNILRYLSDDTAYSTGLCALIGFNYLGEMSAQDSNDGALFTAMTEISAGDDFAPQNVFGPDISINCSVIDGKLEAGLAYNTKVFTEQQAQQLLDGMIESLHEITEHTSAMQHVEVTASDLGEYEWTDEEFQHVYNHFNELGTPLQRIYPLSPMQEGMALKFMLEPDSLAYRLVSRFALDILPTEEQMRYTLDQLGAKHEVLRTSFIYRDVEHYRQAIVDRPLGLEMRDVTTATDKEEAIMAMYKAEQQRGFDMEDQSLFRLICVKTSDTTSEILLAVHHIIVDGWCIRLFMNDLILNLADAVQGKMKPIEHHQTGRYEKFVRELSKKNTNKGLAYWKNLLEGYATKAVIPSTGMVPEHERTTDNICSLSITGADMTALAALTASSQTTMNTVVELAWGLVLQIYNRQDDVVFVKIVSGRNNASESVEDVVGLFINSVPVRVRTTKGTTVVQALQALQQQAAETNEWDFCPLSAIQQQSDLGADLFQSIVAFENYNSGAEKADDSAPFHVKMIYSKEESINDLTITANTDGTHELTVNLEFDPTKYRKGEIEQVKNVLKQLLLTMAQHPEADVSTMPSLTREDIIELTKLGQGERLSYDVTKTLVDLFVEQARKTPDNTCIVFQEKHLTFREVDTITDQLAVLLQQQYDVQPEMAVGVMIDRSELMLLYPMAIMKAGAAYMPLDFHFPAERLSFMCEDAGVKLILSEGNRVAEAMPDFKGQVLTSDVFEHLDKVKGKLNPKWKAQPENMFVILYTSGSTGTPKGVVLEHRNIVNFCHWYVKDFDVTAEDRSVAYANFGFDAHMIDIYPVTSVGGSVYIIPSDMRMDLTGMNEYMEREHLNLAFMTTQVGSLFATTIENHSLRLLSVGGEKLQPLKKPPFTFYNVYGPTECTLFSTFYNIDRDYENSYIGRPLAGYQLYVVDANMNLVPQGVAGELIVAGIGVGRGYLNRPEQTAEKFITFKGQKAYRTGDLVRWSPDGNIDFIGRIDTQVKLRGLRIELGEIEARVSKYPHIMTTTVDVKEVSGAQHICCYFTADAQIDIDGLKEFLSEKLTDYMLPTAYLQMEKLPLTPNGKVNRKALPVPEITSNAIYEELAGGMETTIARIFEKVLNKERVGANDNFFEIGGTSLNAIKVIVEANKQKVPFILNDLFTQKTPRALASYITQRTENSSENQANEDDVPMSSEANDSSLSPLNALLHDNTLDSLRHGERQPIGDVLLTGATGFLGIHVLKRLLNHYDGKIYCPVRCGKGEEPLHKIKNLFFYYFDDQDFEALEKRVIAFAAEITQPGALDSLQVEGLTVVNCVANVKHFSSGKDIEFVNIESVRHLITFCLRTHSRLIHVSTMSVAGQSVDGSPSLDVQFTEQDFDIGQHVKSNQYVNSKFEAERLVLQAMQDHGLQAKIMRVGNLSARTSDGEFQINFNSNNAMALLRVQALLRAIPYETLDKPFECSPIDETAHAILLLAETPKECVVFHPYNNHTILTADILKGFEKNGILIQKVESDQFQQILNEAFMNEDLSMLLRPLLAYDNDKMHKVTEVRHSNSYTTQVLYRLGFTWQQTDQNYVAQFVKALAGLGYFDLSLLKKLNA